MDSFDNWVNGRLMLAGRPTEAVLKLIMTALLGGLVGPVRGLRGQEAGFRPSMIAVRRRARLIVQMPWEGEYRMELIKKLEAAGMAIIDDAYHRHESLNDKDVTIDIG